jgi:hypothetical protein
MRVQSRQSFRGVVDLLANAAATVLKLLRPTQRNGGITIDILLSLDVPMMRPIFVQFRKRFENEKITLLSSILGNACCEPKQRSTANTASQSHSSTISDSAAAAASSSSSSSHYCAVAAGVS